MAQQLHERARGKQRCEETGLELQTRQFVIQDQNQDDVAIAWCLPDGYEDDLPPFPFQVYVLGSAPTVINDMEFPRKFAVYVDQIRNRELMSRHHFQVYKRPFPNMLACVAHQQREILYRNRNGIVPRMLAEWTSNDHSYAGHILIIDTNDWADKGVIIVKFDLTKYKQREFPHWNIAGSGDVDLIIATRYRDQPSLNRSLMLSWLGAGSSWTEDDLRRRNDGGASPVLYPAIDPAAHHDAEHEVHELDGTPLDDHGADSDDDSEDGIPRIIDTFDLSELFMQDHELPAYRSEVYSDNFGLPVTSVWDGNLSRVRPRFSFTLYLAFDFFDRLEIHPKALFRCLNKGLIAQEAWALDIVRNMPSLDAAFQYHARATMERTPQRVEHRRNCMNLVIQRIAATKLPSEILEYIEDALVPPEIPKYSSRPRRPFANAFLYLDKTRQFTGPLIVYSNPDPACRNAASPDQILNEPGGAGRTIVESVLRVVYLRYWHRVADELHVLWSLCGPRCIDIKDRIVPSAHLKLTVPEACVWRSTFGIQFINGHIDAYIMLDALEEIVIPCHDGIFSHDLWNECVDIVDLATGDVLPPQPPLQRFAAVCLDSWAQTPQLGFKMGFDRDLEMALNPEVNFQSFPGKVSAKLGLRPNGGWWQYYVRTGLLKGGREYAFRLRPGLCIPRWTYGTNLDRKGPLNLPPIPVTVDETLHPFKFRVESIGAPHGSFNR